MLLVSFTEETDMIMKRNSNGIMKRQRRRSLSSDWADDLNNAEKQELRMLAFSAQYTQDNQQRLAKLLSVRELYQWLSGRYLESYVSDIPKP